ncbi:MAG: CPBP family intramembrane metalloprotease [Myxococcales bacterium]|nr:CPBP family intramembrane metalloprotease [Myxococcales bacterium]
MIASIVGGVAVGAGAAALLWLGRESERATRGEGSALAMHRRYQPRALAVASLVFVCAWAARAVDGPVRWPRFLRFGDVGVIARSASVVAEPGDTWLVVGVRFAAIASLMTAFVVWRQSRARPDARSVARALPWASIASIVNATSEELLFRGALVTALDGVASPGAIALVAGALFGVPHYWGRPGGAVGALMAGFLGWLATHATLQTGGLGWAIAVHFALDVVILAQVFAIANVERAR